MRGVSTMDKQAVARELVRTSRILMGMYEEYAIAKKTVKIPFGRVEYWGAAVKDSFLKGSWRGQIQMEIFKDGGRQVMETSAADKSGFASQEEAEEWVREQFKTVH